VYRELSNLQRKTFVDAAQTYLAWIDARQKFNRFAGGMTWKNSGGKDYLFKLSGRGGYGKSMGARNEETSKIFNDFHAGKTAAKTRLDGLTDSLAIHAGFCKAASLERVPYPSSSILRLVDQSASMRSMITVIGTTAIYAYESLAGVAIDSDLLATSDVDLMMDSRKSLKLFGGATDGTLISLLQKADRSFQISETQPFRAVNKDGFMVDLVKPTPHNRFLVEASPLSAEDINPIEIYGLGWMQSSPTLTQIVIGADGFPFGIRVPDPRAFAAYKLWMSGLADREPVKRSRDRAQALAIIGLLKTHLTMFPVNADSLKMFPLKIAEDFERKFNSIELPAGDHATPFAPAP